MSIGVDLEISQRFRMAGTEGPSEMKDHTGCFASNSTGPNGFASEGKDTCRDLLKLTKPRIESRRHCC